MRTDRHKLIHYYQLDEWAFFASRARPLRLESGEDFSPTLAVLRQPC